MCVCVCGGGSSLGEDQAGHPTAEEGDHADGHPLGRGGARAASGQAEGQNHAEQAGPQQHHQRRLHHLMFAAAALIWFLPTRLCKKWQQVLMAADNVNENRMKFKQNSLKKQ